MADRSRNQKVLADELSSKLDWEAQYSFELSKEKEGSSWLSALPLKAHSFHLHKTTFRDAVN